MPVWSLMSVVVICFNPFRTGRGLSTMIISTTHNRRVSIPLEQGRVFRPSLYEISQALHVSIPLEQGEVFRPKEKMVLQTGRAVSIPLE